MTNLLFSMKLNWDSAGRLTHHYSKSWDEPEFNIKKGLLPSLPLLVSHQLGVYKLPYALNTCHKLMQLFEMGTHSTVPINSALASAEIFFIQKGQGARFSFKPKRNSFFANSDSLEEASGQLVNNFSKYAIDIAPKLYLPTIWAFINGAIAGYVETLEKYYKTGKISRDRLNWIPGIGIEMSHMTKHISEQWRVYPELLDADTERELIENVEGIKQRVAEGYTKVKNKFNGICSLLDIRVS